MLKRIIIISLAVVSMHGCFNSDLVFEDQFEPVLEAYLFQDRLVENVKLSSMYSFGSDTTIGGLLITDAMVQLQRDEDTWLLRHNDNDSGSYFTDLPIDMLAGDTFKITVTIGEEILSASTVIPKKPPIINMSATTLKIKDVDDPREFMELEMPDPIEFTWENPGMNYYFFRIQNIESYDDPIRPDPPVDRPFRMGGFNFQMDTRPTNDAYFSLSPRELTNFGTHRIIVYSVNEEYVSLYNSLDQDSRELNEPYTNIVNGLGIFTAFSSDTLYLEVIPD